MIPIVEISDMIRLSTGEQKGCVLFHRADDEYLLDALDPIADALGTPIMHMIKSKHANEWLDLQRIVHRYPLVVLFNPGIDPVTIYRPRLQQVVDLCRGRLYV